MNNGVRSYILKSFVISYRWRKVLCVWVCESIASVDNRKVLVRMSGSPVAVPRSPTKDCTKFKTPNILILCCSLLYKYSRSWHAVTQRSQPWIVIVTRPRAVLYIITRPSSTAQVHAVYTPLTLSGLLICVKHSPSREHAVCRITLARVCSSISLGNIKAYLQAPMYLASEINYIL